MFAMSKRITSSADTISCQRIRSTLDAHAISMQNAANRLGIKRSTMSCKVNGRSPFTIPEIRILSHLTGQSADYLIAADV